jgi:hypothetical protein
LLLHFINHIQNSIENTFLKEQIMSKFTIILRACLKRYLLLYGECSKRLSATLLRQTLILFLVQPFATLPLFSLPNFWEISKDHSILYINNKKVFDSREPSPRTLSEELTPTETIEYLIYLSEYYLNKNDKENLANLLYLIRTSAKNLQFAEVFINSMWLLDKGDTRSLEQKLDTYIKSQKDEEEKPFLQALKVALTQKNLSGSIAGEVPGFKKFSCQGGSGYYSLCQALKLRTELEQLEQKKALNRHKEYQNLDKALAPFFEDERLSYISFLDRLIPSLPQRLAYLGFAYEAVFFQSMYILSEKNASFFNIVSFERLSFYQLMSNDPTRAETTLKSIIPILEGKNYLKNSTYLKLGAIAYIQKNYDASLQYFLSLNLKYWNKSMRHPFLDRFLSINAAKELISISIWKSRTASKAAEALSKIKPSQLTESDLFTKLRMAQIMMHDRPMISQNISNEVIYQAQSKGWKRVEYAATIMNGYCHIITKNYRKAVIQFTKSYGILGKTDPGYSSEWLRKMGLYIARTRRIDSIHDEKIARELLSYLKQENRNEEMLMFQNYTDERFGVENFQKRVISLFLKNKKYREALELVLQNYYDKLLPLPTSLSGSLQVPFVDKQLELYSGLRPIQDKKFIEGSYAKIRENERKRLESKYSKFDMSALLESEKPVILVLPFYDSIYAFLYSPQSSTKWNVIQTAKKNPLPKDFFPNYVNSHLDVMQKQPLQIFMNSFGLELYHYIYSSVSGSLPSVFFSIRKNVSENPPDIVAVSAECNNSTDSIGYEDIQRGSPEFFEGKKKFKSKERIHIWDFKESNFTENPEIPLQSHVWKCSKDSEISFHKIQRRMYNKNVPYSILVTKDVLYSKEKELLPLHLLDWSDFWMKKGVNYIFYIDSLRKKDKGMDELGLMKKYKGDIEDFDELLKQHREEKKPFIVIKKYLH